MKIPFLGGAYASRSSNASSQQAINLYYEPPPKHEGHQGTMVAPAGAKQFANLGQSFEVRGGYNYRNIAYFVIGNGFYEVSPTGDLSQRGTLTTDAGRLSFVGNDSDQLGVFDGAAGYIYDPKVHSFTQITDIDFLPTDMVVHQDSYFLAVRPGTNQFALSNLGNGLAWGGLDIQSAEGHPDYLVSNLSDRRELWLFGEETTEVWYNQGDADNPFTRFQGGYIEAGIAAKFTPAKFDNSVVWLGKNTRGQAQVLRAGDGFMPQVISTPEVDYQIQQYTRIDDAWAYVYQMEGHEFYVLNFPSAGAVWALDALTKEWATRGHNIDSIFPNRERYNCYVFAYGKHLLGDFRNGRIYELDSSVFTIEENGPAEFVDVVRVERILTSPAITADNESRISIAEFQLDMEEGVGSDAEVWLSYSKDGGHTWSNERKRTVGATGAYAHRIIWRKLGIARNWIFRIRTWSTKQTIIKGAYARIYGEDF